VEDENASMSSERGATRDQKKKSKHGKKESGKGGCSASKELEDALQK